MEECYNIEALMLLEVSALNYWGTAQSRLTKRNMIVTTREGSLLRIY